MPCVFHCGFEGSFEPGLADNHDVPLTLCEVGVNEYREPVSHRDIRKIDGFASGGLDVVPRPQHVLDHERPVALDIRWLDSAFNQGGKADLSKREVGCHLAGVVPTPRDGDANAHHHDEVKAGSDCHCCDGTSDPGSADPGHSVRCSFVSDIW